MNEKVDFTEQYAEAFAEDQQEFELQEMVAKANNVVLGFTTSTGATGAIPIPFADAPLLIAQQVTMMGAINAVFHITVGKEVLKSLAMAAIGVSGTTIIGKTVATGLLKLIPGAGTIAGGAVAAGTAAAIDPCDLASFCRKCHKSTDSKMPAACIIQTAGIFYNII